MQPHLDIRRTGPNFFTYSVCAGQAPACHCEEALDSLEGCLNDAGESLGHYFPEVSVSLNGLYLGNYSVEHLLRHPDRLAVELVDKAHHAELKAA